MTHDQGVVTSIAGNAARTSAVSAAEGRLKVDMVDHIYLLEPNLHPFVSLITNVGRVYDGKSYQGQSLLKKSCGNSEFKWLEDRYGGRYCKVSGTYAAAGAVTITVVGAGTSSAHIFTKGDVMVNQRTGERMLVDAVASATTINILAVGRSFGSTSAAAGADADELFIVGNVNEENSGARNVNTTRSETESNYTQIFKTSIALSDTEKESDLYGGKDLRYFRAKKGTEHLLDVERAFMWGEKKYDTNGTQGHPRRATGGILEFLEAGNSYAQSQGGTLTAPDFNTFLREGFTYGNSTKLFMCGGIVLQAINEFARGQLQTKPLISTYGVKVTHYVTAFGEINIVHNPLFVGEYAGYGMLLDMECFKYRYMNNRDTKLLTNVQANDIDGEIDQYLTECGLQRVNAPKCALLKDVAV